MTPSTFTHWTRCALFLILLIIILLGIKAENNRAPTVILTSPIPLLQPGTTWFLDGVPHMDH